VLPDVQFPIAFEGSFVYWTYRQLKTYDYCAYVRRYCNWLAVLTVVEFLVFVTGKAVVCVKRAEGSTDVLVNLFSSQNFRTKNCG